MTDAAADQPAIVTSSSEEVERSRDDAAAIACALVEAHPKGASWLDGGVSAGSVLGIRPEHEIADPSGDGLAMLDALSAELASAAEREPTESPTWIGWLTYDVGAKWLVGSAAPQGDVPAVVIRRYGASLRFGSGDGGKVHAGVRVVGARRAGQELRDLYASTRPRTPGAWPMGELHPTITAHEYRSKVQRAKQSIAAGETYQVNLSQRFVAPWRDGPCEDAATLARRAIDLHMRVRQRADAPMGALLHVADDTWFVSNSPETLLDLRHDPSSKTTRLASWPIKGTGPRGHDQTSDERSLAALRTSVKDLAEHVMIVDLVRNDLGRVAVPGSVRAPARPTVVTLPTVHHFVSEVSCSLRPGTSLRHVFEALFPGGSITGAPKRRTVEIIADLEGEPRGIYCGAILFADACGVRVSIPIRTAILRPEGVELRSGGGIVADSDPEAERVETEVKTRAFLPGASA